MVCNLQFLVISNPKGQCSSFISVISTCFRIKFLECTIYSIEFDPIVQLFTCTRITTKSSLINQ